MIVAHSLVLIMRETLFASVLLKKEKVGGWGNNPGLVLLTLQSFYRLIAFVS